ncbi:hypothetical protein HispidOSU_006803, partial [Sigmodon hispidus]
MDAAGGGRAVRELGPGPTLGTGRGGSEPGQPRDRLTERLNGPQGTLRRAGPSQLPLPLEARPLRLT